MDSGSAVPTLSPGLSDTVAEKLLTVASGRCGVTVWPVLENCGGVNISGADPAAFMLMRNARFLAVLRAGRSIAAITATITMTINNSINVKAQRPLRSLRNLKRVLMLPFLWH